MLTAELRITSSANSDPDVALMLRVQRDDVAAFEALVARHKAGVQQQLQLMVADRDEAEDLAQEVFLRVYRHRKNYQPTAKFVTWLFHIVRNVGRNALRSRRRRPVLPFGATAPLAERAGPLPDLRGEAPSRPLERGELRQMVRIAMQSLHCRQRHALFLQQFEDRSYNEIADQLALTPKAAKSLLYRARNQMREVLSPYVVG
jgi:RNA polymerase sigma-70 factor (ECF subfamily)